MGVTTRQAQRCNVSRSNQSCFAKSPSHSRILRISRFPLRSSFGARLHVRRPPIRHQSHKKRSASAFACLRRRLHSGNCRSSCRHSYFPHRCIFCTKADRFILACCWYHKEAFRSSFTCHHEVISGSYWPYIGRIGCCLYRSFRDQGAPLQVVAFYGLGKARYKEASQARDPQDFFRPLDASSSSGTFVGTKRDLGASFLKPKKKSQFSLSVLFIYVLEVMILFFPLLTDLCRRIERPRPISQWTSWGKL
jgi:hypothetical protein